MLIFNLQEQELIQTLYDNGLPSVICPLLVRSEETKKRLTSIYKKVSEKDEKSQNKTEFIQTFAGFKGLERKKILIWNPAEGSESFLDVTFDPKRGEQARKKEFSVHTSLLELRQVFVGITRARHLLGIICPNDSHFVNEMINIGGDSFEKSSTNFPDIKFF